MPAWTKKGKKVGAAKSPSRFSWSFHLTHSTLFSRMVYEKMAKADTPLNTANLAFPSKLWFKVCWSAFQSTCFGFFLVRCIYLALTALALWGWYALNVHLIETRVISSLGVATTIGDILVWMALQFGVLLISGLVVFGIVVAVVQIRNKLERHRLQEQQQPVSQQASDAAV